MPITNYEKIYSQNGDLFLRVSKGHYATAHSHVNYYIDFTTQKSRLSEAKGLARELVANYQANTIVDTVLCLDGTEVIGACLAEELTEGHYINMNAHQTIYVLSPEYSSGGQQIFRENYAPMIAGKHVLVLAASIANGNAVRSAVQAVKYYGGMVAGVCALFSTEADCLGHPICAVFGKNDLPDYESHPSYDCPLCREGKKIDALVNSFGYSQL